MQLLKLQRTCVCYRRSGSFTYSSTVTNAAVTFVVPVVTASTVATIAATEVTVSATGTLVVLLTVLQ